MPLCILAIPVTVVQPGFVNGGQSKGAKWPRGGRVWEGGGGGGLPPPAVGIGHCREHPRFRVGCLFDLGSSEFNLDDKFPASVCEYFPSAVTGMWERAIIVWAPWQIVQGRIAAGTPNIGPLLVVPGLALSMIRRSYSCIQQLLSPIIHEQVYFSNDPI